MADLRLLEDFRYLFEGNPDAYGTESGGCVRSSPPWEEHLYGSTPIGIYPTWIDSSAKSGRLCNWGCVDLDVKTEKKPKGDYVDAAEAMVAAINLTRALEALGLKGWIEQTRSDGRHVWVFKQQADMGVMRSALLIACQLARVKPTEVNPKSFDPAPEELGNYVRLCYPHAGFTYSGMRVGVRQVYQTPDSFWNVGNFVSAALEGVDDLGALEAAARLYKAPSAPLETLPRNSGCVAPQTLRGLPGAIWRDGRLEGADRSGTLFKMGVALAKQGYPLDQMAEILMATDEKWFAKYSGRRDPWKWYVETAKNAQTASRDS